MNQAGRDRSFLILASAAWSWAMRKLILAISGDGDRHTCISTGTGPTRWTIVHVVGTPLEPPSDDASPFEAIETKRPLHLLTSELM